MPLPSVTFRSELDPIVRKELDQLDGELTGYLLQEHDDDGKHTRITAQAIAVDGTVTITGGLTVNGLPVPGAAAPPLAHHVSHEPGGSDALVNAAWTHQANTFTQPNTFNQPITVKTIQSPDTFLATPGHVNAQGTIVANGQITGASVVGTNGFFEFGRTLQQGLWQDYTPVWSSNGTAPTLGNGLLVGRYTLIGKTCHYMVRLDIGSTTGLGSGSNYFFTWPVTAALMAVQAIGNGEFVSQSGARVSLWALQWDATRFAVWKQTDTASGTAFAPAGTAVNDSLRIMGTYEIA